MIIQASDLTGIRIEKCTLGEIIVFCSGSFDITHPGHVVFLEDCKKLGDVLVVAVGSDVVIEYRKPGRPIMNETARLKMIDSLKPVDYCYLDTITTPENLLGGVEYAFKNLRPRVYAINDDAFDIEIRRALCSQFKVLMRIIDKAQSEFPLMSTTAIIEKICSLR